MLDKYAPGRARRSGARKYLNKYYSYATYVQSGAAAQSAAAGHHWLFSSLPIVYDTRRAQSILLRVTGSCRRSALNVVSDMVL